MLRMRKLLTAAFASLFLTTSAFALTYLGIDAEFHAISFTDLPNINANSLFGNTTGSAAAGTSVPVPTCSLLAYTGGTGFSCGASGGSLVSIQNFTSSVTVTIPASATKAYIKIGGATGGSGGVSSTGRSGGSGGPGYLETYLTGLTPGNTFVWTQGAAGTAGASTPTAGGNAGTTTLASGTQTISTLTVTGSTGTAGATTTITAGTTGGVASGGNLVNLTGQTGITPSTTSLGVGGAGTWGIGADGVFGAGTAGKAGIAATMTIIWFS